MRSDRERREGWRKKCERGKKEKEWGEWEGGEKEKEEWEE